MLKSKLPRRNRVYDILHRTAVTGVIGAVMYIVGLTIYKSYDYYTVQKPIKAERVRIIREEEMLAMQRAREEGLLTEQEILEMKLRGDSVRE